MKRNPQSRKSAWNWSGLALCLALPSVAALGQASYPTPYTFTTLAGIPGYGSADGSGSAARFNDPEGVAVDTAGNLYVADTYNNTLRKMTLVGTNWIVTTLAGVAGNTGAADGAGSAASFNGPLGLTVDSSGNLYVADTGNNTIRKATQVGTNWVVTTLAGMAGNTGGADGTGGAASFDNPADVAVDTAGNLYVADAGNNTIRKVRPVGTNWVVTTLAGLAGSTGSADGTGSAASFNYPEGVAADSAGYLYVTDTGNNTIRKVTPVGTNWVVTTLAGLVGSSGSADGTGKAATFNYPAGLGVDAAGNLYVADEDNYTIRKVAPAGTNWVVTTLAGLVGSSGSADGTGKAATFNYPTDVTVDGAGNLYLADSVNNSIRKLTPAGTNWVATTLAGESGSKAVDGTGTAARFNYPSDVAVDSSGNLYVTDTDNNTIRKVTAVGTNWVVTTIAGLAGSAGSADGTNSVARFSNPVGLAIDEAGSLYVADAANNTIRKVTPVGTNWVVTTLAGTSGSAGSADGTGNAASFSYPADVALDSAGNLYIADEGNNEIRKVAPVGTNWVVTTLAGSGGMGGGADGTGRAAQFNEPYGLTVDSAGNLYVADYSNDAIRKVAPVGTNWIVTTLAGVAGVAGSADGAGSAARFNGPNGVAVDGAGSLYVADYNNHAIRKVTPVGTSWVVTTLGGLAGSFGSANGTGSGARLFDPSNLKVDNSGNLYVADSGNNTLRKGYPALAITPTGTSFALTGGKFGFALYGLGGKTVVVDASTDLLNWSPIWTNVLTFPVPLDFGDTNTPAHSIRFYRARTP